jgi:selenocysteine lyase/cysteine desulfurase
MLTDTLWHAPVLASDTQFAALRAREFGRLDAAGHTYLDFTGSALYPRSLVDAHAAMLCDAVLGNPHSENPASLASSALVAEARARVLTFFDADPGEYAVVFTGNATGAIRLVADGFAFGPRSPLVLSADNHNSINGVREMARRAGAATHVLPLAANLMLDDGSARLARLAEGCEGGLLAFPAQSNFSGALHSLSLVREARALGFRVLLDAAAYVPTHRLSLGAVPADFVALSFYKMFGYPTGVGALIARRDALACLTRPWFAGGTVEWASVQQDRHQRRAGAEGFEDGSPNFGGIAAVSAGLDFLDRVGLDRIEQHVRVLTERLVRGLRALRGADGRPMVDVYGPHGRAPCGATVAFNVRGGDGRVIPFAAVEARAAAARVSVRGGCFCNPGASERAFGFAPARTARCLERAREGGWTIDRFAACMEGTPVGAVRASLGVPSDAADVDRLLAAVASMAD